MTPRFRCNFCKSEFDAKSERSNFVMFCPTCMFKELERFPVRAFANSVLSAYSAKAERRAKRLRKQADSAEASANEWKSMIRVGQNN